MATKKQKRESALANREKFLAEVRAAGLETQRLDQEAQEKQEQLMKSEADRINQRYRNILAKVGVVIDI